MAGRNAGILLCMGLLALSRIYGGQIDNLEEVHLAAILPEQSHRLFSIQRVYSALRIAINKTSDMLPKHIKLRLHNSDSKCNIAQGIRRAIELFTEKRVHAFLGPACDYAVAPVARQAKFWNLPVITPGALSSDFSNRGVYSSLTRIGANTNTLADFITKYFKDLTWNKMLLVYQKFGQGDVIDLLCHLVAGGIDKAVNLSTTYYRWDEKDNLGTILSQEIGLNKSGKYK